MKHIQNHTRCLARLAWNSTFFIGCLTVPVAHAAITFQFEYDDPVGTGFRDPVYGTARQAALNTAATTFSSMFGSHFSNSGTITLQATAKRRLLQCNNGVCGQHGYTQLQSWL